MQERSLTKISLTLSLIGTAVLYIVLATQHQDLDTGIIEPAQIIHLTGDITGVSQSPKTTTLQVEHLQNDEVLVFDNVSVEKGCADIIAERLDDTLVAKKIRKCKKA